MEIMNCSFRGTRTYHMAQVILQLAAFIPSKYTLTDLPVQTDIIRHWVKYLLLIISIVMYEQL